MIDYEIQQIRRVRRQISAECEHDLEKLAAYYRKLEDEFRKTNKYRFADRDLIGMMAEDPIEG